jgi:polynucleotide 5'-kinase involved in rRNA processing
MKNKSIRKLLSTILAVTITISLSSCSNNKVSQVQNSTLKIDETRTINDVLKNCELLSNQSWQYFEAKDGSQVVEFNADINTQKLNDSFAEEMKQNESNKLISWMRDFNKFKKAKYKWQFLVSKANDNEFKLGEATVNYIASISNQAGTIEDVNGEVDCDKEILLGLYNNSSKDIALSLVTAISVDYAGKHRSPQQ